MSHEIRTPMNAVIGMLELTLKRADQGQLDRPTIEVAYDSAKDLLELIGDILDIARIESGRLTLTPQRVNLRELVESVARVFDGLARHKNLDLTVTLEPGADREVLLDPLRFKQILSNLVSNAIKFTEQGQVSLHLQLHTRAIPPQMQLELLVRDTGIGISSSDQQRLFEPFAQAEPSGPLARSGTGLGLVICRSLCEMMGGQLTLESQVGRGTQARVLMNIIGLEPDTSAPQPAQPLLFPNTALNVLVVDDHPANRLLMSQQLEYLGLRHDTAPNGAAGLSRWLQERFDVVIADCNMPLMNGYDLTRAIRAHEQCHGMTACTVLGYTANAQPEERERCQQAGMDDCLFKPISLTTLNQRLAAVTAQPQAEVTTDLATFNLQGLGPLTGDDPQMLQRLCDQILHCGRQDAALLEALDLQDNRPALVEMAHKIKGAARIVQAEKLIQTCETLERSCTQQVDDNTLDLQRRQVLQAMLELEQALRQTLAGKDDETQTGQSSEQA